MTANLLTLNSSKTEFLLIGLKNQLAKIHNSSLDTSHSARNLGFIFDEHLTFADQIIVLLLSPKPVTITFINFAVYGHTLIRQLSVPLLPLSFTPNLITVILTTINSVSLNYPVSSISRTLLLVLSWKIPSHVISLRSYALDHWLRITERTEYQLLSLTYKVLTTTQPPYLHKLISTQRPRSTRSSSVVTLARPPSSSSLNKNSSGDEIANVNFLRRYRTYVLQNTKKENLLRLTN